LDAESIKWRTDPGEFKMDYFAKKSSREKAIELYNKRKQEKKYHTMTQKEKQVFEELPDFNYYDETFLKVELILTC